MAILQEIIGEATSRSGDVSRMLRLCQVLASRLKHEPLKIWVRSELEGYGSQALLPSYRILASRNRGTFVGLAYRGNLDIPLSVLPEEFWSHYNNTELRGAIGEYSDLAMKAESGGVLEIPWPVSLALHCASKVVKDGQCIRAWKEISPSEVVGMIDQIKTRVLGFALDIESDAPEAGNIPGATVDVTADRVNHSFVTNIFGNVGALQTGGGATSLVNGIP